MSKLPSRLHHTAYVTKDLEATRHFYEDILGLPMVNCMMAEKVPSTGLEQPYVHFFFQLGDGSYIAFFDLGGGEMPAPSPNTPDWVQHFAIETNSVADVDAMRLRLAEHGVKTTPLVDHEFVRSIYFFDPNGLRLEIAARTEAPGFLDAAASEAHEILRAWNERKHGTVAAH